MRSYVSLSRACTNEPMGSCDAIRLAAPAVCMPCRPVPSLIPTSLKIPDPADVRFASALASSRYRPFCGDGCSEGSARSAELVTLVSHSAIPPTRKSSRWCCVSNQRQASADPWVGNDSGTSDSSLPMLPGRPETTRRQTLMHEANVGGSSQLQ